MQPPPRAPFVNEMKEPPPPFLEQRGLLRPLLLPAPSLSRPWSSYSCATAAYCRCRAMGVEPLMAGENTAPGPHFVHLLQHREYPELDREPDPALDLELDPALDLELDLEVFLGAVSSRADFPVSSPPSSPVSLQSSSPLQSFAMCGCEALLAY